MAEGVEMLVGITYDDVFGPIVACGAGGTIAELLKDVGGRDAPVTDVAAHEMIHSLATFPLLEGYRGRPARTWPPWRRSSSGSARSLPVTT
jgi:acetate---CoA ligase (ADP-forming)